MSEDYVIRVLTSPAEVDAQAWDQLLLSQTNPSPFMRHAYLAALDASDSACQATGWSPHFILLQCDGVLQAACVVYAKTHSYGEYVFDWAWANAYAQHGLEYYPKAVVAVPFTPVPSTRLLAVNAVARSALVKALLAWCQEQQMSSLHLLFGEPEDVVACEDAGLLLRHTVQFHWTNNAPVLPAATGAPSFGYPSFDAFLATLSQDKRKKIRQERRKVQEAGVTFRCMEGTQINKTDWDFFYRCYERTYLEHGNAPYLTRDFFHRMATHLPEAWVLFIAERNGRPIATSLIAVQADFTWTPGTFDQIAPPKAAVAYGRYWGALERVDCLHFEACYYQPLAWCIANGYQRFEGGAQGEHKMARALLPVKTSSAHWLAHPAFADAVARFLEREGEGIENYLGELGERSPFRAD
jgi:predicted N-acyltransferase